MSTQVIHIMANTHAVPMMNGKTFRAPAQSATVIIACKNGGTQRGRLATLVGTLILSFASLTKAMILGRCFAARRAKALVPTMRITFFALSLSEGCAGQAIDAVRAWRPFAALDAKTIRLFAIAIFGLIDTCLFEAGRATRLSLSSLFRTSCGNACFHNILHYLV